MYIILLSAEYPPQPGGVGDYTRRLALALAERSHRLGILTGQPNGTLELLNVTSQIRTQLLKNSKLKTQNAKLTWGWRCLSDVARIVAREQPDVLHIQYQTGAYGMHPAINLLPRYLALRGLRHHTAVVVTFHDLLEPYLFPKAGRLRHWITLQLARDADSVVTTNEADARELELAVGNRQSAVGRKSVGSRQSAAGETGQKAEGSRREVGDTNHSSLITHHSSLVTTQNSKLKPQHFSLIPIGSNIPVAPPTGYDRADWRKKLEVESSETLVAYFGLLSRSKGVDVLLDALAQFRAERRMKLLLIGGEATAPQDQAYAAEIAEQIARLKLQDRIIRTGQVDEATVSAHLLAADIVALPFRDGASFRRGSLLAALAHGCAVVTTGMGDRRWGMGDGGPRTEDREARTEEPVPNPQLLSPIPQFKDGENVLLVPPDDSAAIATALERLAGDAALRSRLVRGARTLAEHFSWDEIARQHEELYQMQKTGG